MHSGGLASGKGIMQDKKGILMNKKAAQMAADYYVNTLETQDIARIDFFMNLWAVLEDADAAGEYADAYEAPDSETVRKLSESASPVLSAAPAKIDAAALSRSVCALCARAYELDGFDEETSEALTQVNWDDVITASPYELAGQNPVAYLEALMGALGEKDMTDQQAYLGALFVSLALRPQLEGPAAVIAKARKKAKVFFDHQMHCPVCGSDAALANVGEGGSGDGRNKQLWCPQCATVWEFDRVRCPRCGTRNQAHLHYYNIEGDEAHRIGTCDECGGYMRTRFSGEGDRAPLSYEVEDVVMAKLDAIAADPSFAPGKAE